MPVGGDGLRARSDSETLEIARIAGRRAGVTRLGDVSGLAPTGVPVFQAIRPRSRSLSVSQGKGLTRTAAMISALLEASELRVAENVAEPVEAATAGAVAESIWSTAPRDPLAIRLDPARPRGWLPARDLVTGADTFVPWDLVSMDFTRAAAPDIARTSAGLATGGTLAEATASAVAELIEHDCIARFRHFGPAERRACELDPASVDDPAIRRLIGRIVAGGLAIRAWSIGRDLQLPVFRCAILDLGNSETRLPPASGSGCHPAKRVALLRALLEAVQSRITMIAGARDDLKSADYERSGERTLALLMGALSFGAGPQAWAGQPDAAALDADRGLELLLNAVQRRTSLPVLLHRHEPLHPDLAVVRAIAPGLENLVRERLGASIPEASRPAVTIASSRRPVLFVGPSLNAAEIPDTIEARPPARCGDMIDLLRDPPPAIGLIDGVFEVAPTTWHKEILDVMAHGIPVLGAASLGALRAAELAGEGMIGVGAIFAAYRSGELARDDAVMMRHGPAAIGYPPTTIALVDAEHALATVDMPPDERRQLRRIVRTIGHGARTWAACLEAYRLRVGRPASIDAASLARVHSLKAADARALVAMLAERQWRSPRCAPPLLTRFYAAMLTSLARARG